MEPVTYLSGFKCSAWYRCSYFSTLFLEFNGIVLLAVDDVSINSKVESPRFNGTVLSLVDDVPVQ
jgi:hypothetical protein